MRLWNGRLFPVQNAIILLKDRIRKIQTEFKSRKKAAGGCLFAKTMIDETMRNNESTSWPTGIYLTVSLIVAMLMALFTPLNGVPGKYYAIQAGVFLLLMWGRLAWALFRRKQKNHCWFYMVLMIVLPFLLPLLSDVMLPLYKHLARSWN